MRLEGNFYRTRSVEQTDDNYRIEVELMADHPVYKGHFPQQPVVPGVCTLTVIRECIGNILGRQVCFESVKECKYVSALIPHPGLAIVINLSITDSLKVNAVVERVDSGETVLKLKAGIK